MSRRKFRNLAERRRLSEQVALHEVATDAAELVAFLRALDALGDDLCLHVVAERDRGREQYL